MSAWNSPYRDAINHVANDYKGTKQFDPDSAVNIVFNILREPDRDMIAAGMRTLSELITRALRRCRVAAVPKAQRIAPAAISATLAGSSSP